MSRSDIPKGKGLFLWQIRMVQDLYPDDEDQALAAKTGKVFTSKLRAQSQVIDPIVQAALDLGLDWVAPKVSNGIFKYNRRWTGVAYVDDILPPLVKGLQGAGIKVHGWQYIYGWPGFAERYAQQAIDRFHQLGLDGLMINAEKEYKGKPKEANDYASILRARLPDVPIGLSSYRYPSYHSDFPFWEFARWCDYHSPQVYWLGAHNPREQLEKSIGELTTIIDLPIVPAGLAYTEGGYAPPTVAEMDEFHQAVLDFGLPANLWWEWWRASQIDRLKDIAAHTWPGDTPPPPPVNEYNAGWNAGKQDTINKAEASKL